MNGEHPTLLDVNSANAAWGANCGPAAISAVLNLPLDDVRPHMGDFERKGYTNPTLMWAALKSLGVQFSCQRVNEWPAFGLARIQWEGPWTKPGVPMRARYRHTHWVGVNARNRHNIGIFDVNAIGNGTGWCALNDWYETIVPWILDHCVPRADGNWHVTHSVEIAPPKADRPPAPLGRSEQDRAAADTASEESRDG